MRQKVAGDTPKILITGLSCCHPDDIQYDLTDLSVFMKRRATLKKLLSMILVAIAVMTVAFVPAAQAADAAAGAKIFTANCTACHMNGGNLVMAPKTLKKDALETYGMYSKEAIITQVTKGKGAMPAFGGRLSDADIENVAAYVLEQADKW
jgi:cytochrome c6